MRRLLAFGFHADVDLVHLAPVDLLALQQLGIAGVVDLDLLQHLANDHLDVLVVDVDALQPVDLLDFVDQIGRQFLDALDGENVVRGGIAFDDIIALLDDVAILQMDVLALRDQVLLRLVALARRLDRNAALVLVVLAEAHRAADLGDDRRVLRLARLEQLRHPRQTAGDVARLGAFGRNTRDNVARLHVAAGIDRDDRIDRQLVAGVAAASELEDLAARLDHDRRTQVLLVARRARAPVDDDALGDAGRLVELLPTSTARRRDPRRRSIALDLGQDRPRVRIPLGDALAALDLVAILDTQPRTVRNAVMRALGAVGVDDRDHHVAHHRHHLVIRVFGDVLALELDLAVEVQLDERLLGDLRRTADMEGAHGELGTRLADRLRSDDTDRLAHVDRRAPGEIAPVACAAHAVGRLARQHRADFQLLDAASGDDVDLGLRQQSGPLDQGLAGGRILHILRRGPAKDAAGERSNHGAGIDNGADLDAILRAAVFFRDDAVLRHVDQTPREIARVCRLQGGVGETLAGAVRRVEVLEHRQTFLEVGNDRAFDDLARRLGHQAAHAGELAHLRGRTARTGMRHHVDRIDLHVATFSVLLGGRDFAHHFFGDPVGRFRPGVDDLVVLLALGDQTVVVLLLELLRELARRLDDLPLGLRHHHVVLAERDAGLERVVEAERHDPVAEDDRLFLTAMAIDHVDHRRYLALGHQAVDDVERHLHALGQYIAKHNATRRRVVPLLEQLALLVHAFPAVLDLGVQVDDFLMQRMVDRSHVAEGLAFTGHPLTQQREIIKSQHDILRRHDDRLPVRRMQDVVGRHHQHARFQLRFERQRNVHGHLVTVEVGVERRADERMQLDRLALDQHRLEGLDAEAMEGRRAVEQHRMLADNLVEDIPNLRLLLLHELLGLLHRSGQALGVEP